MDIYKFKYLKYKHKYLNLKNKINSKLLTGSGNTRLFYKIKILKNINDIFKDINMSFIIDDKYSTEIDLSKSFELQHKTVKSIRTTKKGTKYTVYFNNIITIYPNEYIYINLLEINPTINASGTIILNKYKKFGQLNNFKYIKLCDSSTKLYNICENHIYYSIISLFLYGKTWYQSHGFDYESNLQQKKNYYELYKDKILDYFLSFIKIITSVFLYGKTWYQSHGFEYESKLQQKKNYYELYKDKNLDYFLSNNEIEEIKNELSTIITSNTITIIDIIKNLNTLYLHTDKKMTSSQCRLLDKLLLKLTEKILPTEEIMYYYF
jgi:hypothetical protein